MDNSFFGSLLVLAVLAGIALAIAWCLVPLILLGTNRRLARLIEQQTRCNTTLDALLAEHRKTANRPPP